MKLSRFIVLLSVFLCSNIYSVEFQNNSNHLIMVDRFTLNPKQSIKKNILITETGYSIRKGRGRSQATIARGLYTYVDENGFVKQIRKIIINEDGTVTVVQ